MVEVLTQPPEVADQIKPPLPEFDISDCLDKRVDQAIEDSEFIASSEMREAVRGFYDAHYTLAAVMDVALEEPGKDDEGQGQKEWLQNIIGSSYFTEIEA